MQDANLSDVLMDRAVMNEANLKNAILQRAVFTRSDLGGANVEGADFTNALLDKTQQMVSSSRQYGSGCQCTRQQLLHVDCASGQVDAYAVAQHQITHQKGQPAAHPQPARQQQYGELLDACSRRLMADHVGVVLLAGCCQQHNSDCCVPGS